MFCEIIKEQIASQGSWERILMPEERSIASEREGLLESERIERLISP